MGEHSISLTGSFLIAMKQNLPQRTKCQYKHPIHSPPRFGLRKEDIPLGQHSNRHRTSPGGAFCLLSAYPQQDRCWATYPAGGVTWHPLSILLCVAGSWPLIIGTGGQIAHPNTEPPASLMKRGSKLSMKCYDEHRALAM